MSLQWTTHPDAEAFLRDARPELERDEAEHGVPLGIALGLRGLPPAQQAPHYFATARDADGLALAVVHTRPRPLTLAGWRADPSAALELLLKDLRRTARPVSMAVGPDPLAERFALLWSHSTGGSAEPCMRQRLHRLTEVQPVAMPSGRFRPADGRDAELVLRWSEAFRREALGDAQPRDEQILRRLAAGELFLWEDGQPRAMAGRARATPNGMTVNSVYTPPESRQRGYATALVAQLSARLLGEGRRFCVLFTDLANPTSNAIYARIGYRPLRDFTIYRLHPEA